MKTYESVLTQYGFNHLGCGVWGGRPKALVTVSDEGWMLDDRNFEAAIHATVKGEGQGPIDTLDKMLNELYGGPDYGKIAGNFGVAFVPLFLFIVGLGVGGEHHTGASLFWLAVTLVYCGTLFKALEK